MRKKNGFVFMETIVVVSVLSITLLILFTSYSYILRKARERNTFDTTEMIYKTYFVKDTITAKYSSVESYFTGNLNKTYCKVVYDGVAAEKNSYVCDITKTNDDMARLAQAFDIEKIYYLNPNVILSDKKSKEYLLSYDATTIDYINKLGKSVAQDLLVVKYRKEYDEAGTDYEIIHSSLEV